MLLLSGGLEAVDITVAVTHLYATFQERSNLDFVFRVSGRQRL